jgi:pSer/pThr/pTyr-binding forkhead associated (FHA) protein
MRQSEHKSGREPRLPPNPLQARIRVDEGGPRGDWPVAEPVMLIGSRRDCPIVIEHGDVSKVHAALVHTGSAVLLCDLRSRAGTFVNENRVTSLMLRPGDITRVGPAKLRLEVSGIAPADDASALPTPLKLTSAGQSFVLRTQPIVVGKRSTCDVVLDTPDVSLAHALIFLIAGCPVVFDLGSRSGTIVNAERVSMRWLQDGDELNIGGERLIVNWAGGAIPAYAAPAMHAAANEPRETAMAAEQSAPPVAPPANAKAAAAPLDLGRVAAAASSLASAAGAGGELDDLAQVIGGFNQRVAAYRLEVQERSAEFARKQAELDAQGRRLAEDANRLRASRDEFDLKRKEFENAQAQWGKQLQDLSEQKRIVQEQTQTLEWSRAALAQEQSKIEQLRQACDARQKQVESLETTAREREQRFAAREHAIGEHEARLHAEKADVDRRQAELHAAHANLSEREQGLQQREQVLAQREAVLAAREQQEAQTARHLEVVKSALREATEILTANLPSGSQNGSNGSPGTPSSNGAPPSGGNGQQAAGNGMPAPIVERPIFGSVARPARVSRN